MTPTLTGQNTLSLSVVTEDHASPAAECSVFTLTRDMRAGSDAAWSEFHRRYYLALLRYAATRTAGCDDAMSSPSQRRATTPRPSLRLAAKVRYQAET